MMTVFYSYSFIIGLILGSFINCLIWRLYQGESIFGRSYCPSCRHQIVWYDNIPLFSFIALKGKCRSCKKKIAWQYPLVELTTGLLFLGATLLSEQASLISLSLLKDYLVIFSLVLIFVYDLRFQLVPMLFLWPILAIIFVLNLLLGYNLLSLSIALTIGIVFFLVQYLLTKKKGIGEGDIWLGAFMALVLVEVKLLVSALVFAYFIGAVVSLIFLARGDKQLKSKISLGPFLMLGSLISYWFGGSILSWYLNLI